MTRPSDQDGVGELRSRHLPSKRRMTDEFEESMQRHAKDMKSWLIDRGLLLLTSVVLAGVAWATIHYLGESYFSISTTVVIVVLLVENWRLHKLLREHGISTRWHKRAKDKS